MLTEILKQANMEPYRQTVDVVLAAFNKNGQSGLGQTQARERLRRYGRNELTAEAPVPEWRKFFAQFTDVLVILLIVAGLVSAGLWLYERDSTLPYEAIAIFAIVLLNALMGYFQQARAEQAVAALRQMSAAHAKVIRDGERQDILATELVPGDVDPHRGGRHHSRRRAFDRIGSVADRGGCTHRREPAGVEGYRPDRGTSGTRRPA